MDNLLLEKKAREWLGTPWVHHQALKKVGCDCVGFLSSATKEAGFIIPSFPNYGRYPVNDDLKKYLEQFLFAVQYHHRKYQIKSGDILLFKFTGINTHVGIATDIGVIHACPFQKKVVEHRIDEVWNKRIVEVYQWEPQSPH